MSDSPPTFDRSSQLATHIVTGEHRQALDLAEQIGLDPGDTTFFAVMLGGRLLRDVSPCDHDLQLQIDGDRGPEPWEQGVTAAANSDTDTAKALVDAIMTRPDAPEQLGQAMHFCEQIFTAHWRPKHDTNTEEGA